MAKITVCDYCKKDGKLVEAKRYISVKGKSFFRVDACDAHSADLPKRTVDIIKKSYELQGLAIDEARAKEIALS